MPRLNIEDTLWGDPRFQELMVRVGNRHTAKGMVLELLTVAQRYWLASHGRGIPKSAWIENGLPNELVECRLARDDGEFVYAVGSREQFAWLTASSENGKKGGPAAAKARAENKGKSKRRTTTEIVEPNPDTTSSSSSSSFSSSVSDSSLVPAAEKTASGPTLGAEIWDAYQEEIRNRYPGVRPVRNKTVNSQLKHLGERLGRDAIDVARFYVRHNKAYYVEKHHTIGLLLADAESLHAQWQRGITVLPSQAREVERSQHNADSFAEAAAWLKDRRKEQGHGT